MKTFAKLSRSFSFIRNSKNCNRKKSAPGAPGIMATKPDKRTPRTQDAGSTWHSTPKTKEKKHRPILQTRGELNTTPKVSQSTNITLNRYSKPPLPTEPKIPSRKPSYESATLFTSTVKNGPSSSESSACSDEFVIPESSPTLLRNNLDYYSYCFDSNVSLINTPYQVPKSVRSSHLKEAKFLDVSENSAFCDSQASDEDTSLNAFIGSSFPQNGHCKSLNMSPLGQRNDATRLCKSRKHNKANEKQDYDSKKTDTIAAHRSCCTNDGPLEVDKEFTNTKYVNSISNQSSDNLESSFPRCKKKNKSFADTASMNINESVGGDNNCHCCCYNELHMCNPCGKSHDDHQLSQPESGKYSRDLKTEYGFSNEECSLEKGRIVKSENALNKSITDRQGFREGESKMEIDDKLTISSDFNNIVKKMLDTSLFYVESHKKGTKIGNSTFYYGSLDCYSFDLDTNVNRETSKSLAGSANKLNQELSASQPKLDPSTDCEHAAKSPSNSTIKSTGKLKRLNSYVASGVFVGFK